MKILNQQMPFICVVAASYTLGFFVTKKSVVSVSDETKLQNHFFCVFIHGKNECHTISWYEKIADHAIVIQFWG